MSKKKMKKTESLIWLQKVKFLSKEKKFLNSQEKK